MAKRLREVAFGVEEHAAFEIVDDTFRILTRGKKPAQVYRCYWHQGKYHEEALPIKKVFFPLMPLLKKGYPLS